jgi:hypothetical protein
MPVEMTEASRASRGGRSAAIGDGRWIGDAAEAGEQEPAPAEAGVRGEWSLVTMAWNMKRIFALSAR